MKELIREGFLLNSEKVLGEIVEIIEGLPELNIGELKPEKTGLLVVDMTNGFAREGALKSQRVEELIPEIMKLSKACDVLNIKKVALMDYHREDSEEFASYPPHCIGGTNESEMVEELHEVGGYEIIHKNSTNGFLEEGFRNWLKENDELDTFILAGDCTDICILQLATSLKAWYNQQERKSRIIVPMNVVDTYDLGVHHGDLMNLFALYNMIINGVEIVRGIN